MCIRKIKISQSSVLSTLLHARTMYMYMYMYTYNVHVDLVYSVQYNIHMYMYMYMTKQVYLFQFGILFEWKDHVIFEIGNQSQRASRCGFGSAPYLDQLVPLVVLLAVGKVREMDLDMSWIEGREKGRQEGGEKGRDKGEREEMGKGKKKEEERKFRIHDCKLHVGTGTLWVKLTR